MSQENVEVVLAAYRALNNRDRDAAHILLDPDVEWHPSLGALLSRPVYRGAQAVVEMALEEIPSLLEGFHVEAVEARGAGTDTVITKARFAARAKASGVPVEQVFFQVYRLRGKQIASMHSYTTEAEALEAVGPSE
jgi:ketosteroid isomerase-like protein